MAPVRHEAPYGATSPIFSYPYERSREALDQLERSAPVDAWDGVKLRYVNPLTGGWPMPTIGTFMQRCPPASRQGLAPDRWRRLQRGRRQRRSRRLQRPGRGALRLRPARSFRGSVVAHCPALLRTGCVLFSFSDRPVHQALGIHSEERLS
jgi:gentisate 1,2-dioxygenase